MRYQKKMDKIFDKGRYEIEKKLLTDTLEY